MVAKHDDGSKNTTAGSLKHLVFPGKIHRKSPQIVSYYGDSKLVRRIIFYTAGSFGCLVHSDVHPKGLDTSPGCVGYISAPRLEALPDRPLSTPATIFLAGENQRSSQEPAENLGKSK